MAKAHCMVTFADPTTGATLLSATVNVYNPGTVTPISATIFDKNNNVLSNPLTSDASTGLVDFYLNVAQEVDLVVAKSGFTTRTYSNVPVLDDASNDLTALLTTTGDMPYASAANTPARLAIGATGGILTVSGGIPAWLAIGTTNQLLGVTGGVPTWTSTPTVTTLAVTSDSVLGGAGLANGATTGFVGIAYGGGTPTGVPSNLTNIPIRFSTADNKLYAYINGGWKASGAFA